MSGNGANRADLGEPECGAKPCPGLATLTIEAELVEQLPRGGPHLFTADPADLHSLC